MALVIASYRELEEVTRALRRDRVFRDRENPLEVSTDEEIYQRFRFDRHGIIFVTTLVTEVIEAPTKRNHAILALLQALVTLRYYACGSFQQVVADTIGIHQSTASRIIHRVTNSLVMRLNEFVRFPANNELQAVKAAFFACANFPNVIGAVDGTHIRIIAPRRHEADFVNRKNFHSINVQVISDARNRLINIVAKWPGSTHDSRILRESLIGEEFEMRAHNGIILGDSGFPCKSWLLTPYLEVQNAAQQRYNNSHKRTRLNVGCTIGIWKRRFRCLFDEIRLDPLKACKVITATAILHNIAKELNLRDFEGEENDEQPDAIPVLVNGPDNATRERYVQQYFQ